MKKDLPSVFPGEIDENVHNTQEIFNSLEKQEDRHDDNLSIEAKINRIFNSPNYIYKKDVLIKMHNQNIKKTIIGKTANNLLTLDNEMINISDIEDISII